MDWDSDCPRSHADVRSQLQSRFKFSYTLRRAVARFFVKGSTFASAEGISLSRGSVDMLPLKIFNFGNF